MDESTTGRVVLANPGVVLVTALVNLKEYADQKDPHHAPEVSMSCLKPLVFITGIGFRWVQNEQRDGTLKEVPGVHLMPRFDQMTLGQMVQIGTADYRDAISHFMATDRQAQYRAVRGLVAEVTVEAQKIVVDLLAEYEKPADQAEWAFRLTSISPPKRR